MKPNCCNKSSILLLVFGCILLAGLSAQNFLTDNPHTRRAQELRRQADAAMEAGEYATAIDLASQIDRENELALAWADNQAWAFRANSMRRLANEQFARVKTFNAANSYPEEFGTASAEMTRGEAAFVDQQWQRSWEYFSAARNAFMAMRAPTTPAVASTVTSTGKVLPKYYTVRKLVEKSDSFWRIASYDFVYGDGRLWPKLYEANKHILRDPNNPHLIHPGMRFVIPSIKDEVREGDWRP